MPHVLPKSVYQITIDALTDQIAVINEQGRIVMVNKAWREFASRNGGDLARVCEGVDYLAVCDRAAATGCQDARRSVQLMREVLQGVRASADFEYPCHSPGEERWFCVKITTLDHAHDAALVLAHENVTGLKRAQQQIRFQADLLASVEQAIIATDLHGTICYWNPFAETLYGWTADEAIGQSIVALLPAVSSVEQAGQIMERLRAGKSWSGEFMVRNRAGVTFPMHVTNSPIRDKQGQLIGVIGISTDIVLSQ